MPSRYDDALDYLYSLINYEIQRPERYAPDVVSLDRPRALLAATLTFLLAGYLYDDLGRAQAMVFTVIVIEVIVAALALAMMVNVYRTTGTLSVLAIQRMKG